MYHETFLFKILGMMDFYSSLSKASPSSLAFVQQFANPQKLNILIQLLMGCLSKGKIIILRIFQDLMKLDFPIEILDKAVNISVKNAEAGSGNKLDEEVAKLLEYESNLDLSNLPFIKLIYNMILKVQQTVWKDRETLNKGSHVLTQELVRIFKSLSQNGDKNLFIQKIVQSKIKESLLKIQTFSGPEIEALMSIVNESSSNQIHIGASCSNPKNQVFTVIGFSDFPYSRLKQRPQEFTSQFDFDPSGRRKIAFGLYFDPNNPERQEIIDCNVRQCKFVRDINDAVLLTSAKCSPFYDKEVVAHFMSILRD